MVDFSSSSDGKSCSIDGDSITNLDFSSLISPTSSFSSTWLLVSSSTFDILLTLGFVGSAVETAVISISCNNSEVVATFLQRLEQLLALWVRLGGKGLGLLIDLAVFNCGVVCSCWWFVCGES